MPETDPPEDILEEILAKFIYSAPGESLA